MTGTIVSFRLRRLEPLADPSAPRFATTQRASEVAPRTLLRAELRCRLARRHPRLLRVREPFGKLVVKAKQGVRIDGAAILRRRRGGSNDEYCGSQRTFGLTCSRRRDRQAMDR